jgi:hypothetical protein
MFQQAFYRAYLNAFDLLNVRGYRPMQGHQLRNPEEFEKLKKSWGEKDSFWILFVNDQEDVVKVAFPGKVDVTASKELLQTALTKEKGKQGHLILIVDSITNDAMGTFSTHERSKVPRSQEIPRQAVIEVFTVSQMQINPLKFCLQPPYMRLLTLKEIESLHKSLVKAIPEKDKPLSELLPMIFFTDPVAIWFGASVGDVIYSIDDNDIPYARYVRIDPRPQRSMRKVDIAEDEEGEE